jgi:hypothetical protein
VTTALAVCDSYGIRRFWLIRAAESGFVLDRWVRQKLRVRW